MYSMIGFEDSIHPPLGVGILDQVFQTFSKFTIWDDGRWMMKFESNPESEIAEERYYIVVIASGA